MQENKISKKIEERKQTIEACKAQIAACDAKINELQQEKMKLAQRAMEAQGAIKVLEELGETDGKD